MSNVVIALLCALSAAAWTYNKFMKTTGGNTKNAIGGATVLGILVFFGFILGLSFIN